VTLNPKAHSPAVATTRITIVFHHGRDVSPAERRDGGQRCAEAERRDGEQQADPRGFDEWRLIRLNIVRSPEAMSPRC